MLVKCRCCAKKIDRNSAYKVVVGGKNAYYCNEKEYKSMIEARKAKDDTYEMINQIFGYKVIHTSLFKEINAIAKTCEYSVISSYLKCNEREISFAINKDFQSEYAKIRYFAAILKNNLRDYHMPEKIEPREVNIENEPTVQHFHRKKKRRNLAELESEV